MKQYIARHDYVPALMKAVSFLDSMTVLGTHTAEHAQVKGIIKMVAESIQVEEQAQAQARKEADEKRHQAQTEAETKLAEANARAEETACDVAEVNLNGAAQ